MSHLLRDFLFSSDLFLSSFLSNGFKNATVSFTQSFVRGHEIIMEVTAEYKDKSLLRKSLSFSKSDIVDNKIYHHANVFINDFLKKQTEIDEMEVTK